MNRRDFSLQLAGAGLGLATAGTAGAQGTPEEGKHYVRLQTAAQVTLPPQKKVEVIEFFWYGCPHCFSFEPTIEAWSKRVAAYVYFRQMPVSADRFDVANRLTLNALRNPEASPRRRLTMGGRE